MKKFVITIAREFGSLGRPIAKRLAELLNVEFYDRDIVEAAAKKMSLPVSVISKHEEKKSGFFQMMFPLGTESMERQKAIFDCQSKIISDLAAKESCIIVGRCADYALKDYDNKLNVFVHAPMSFKKSRIQEQYEIPEAKVKDVAIKTDKQRASYYNYYTSKKWGDLKSYDLCIDSSILGIDGTVELIKQAVALKEK